MWSGKDLDDQLLNKLNPKIAIAFKNLMSLEMSKNLQKRNIKTYSTLQDGAIQYQPKKGFKPYVPEYDIIAN